MPTPEPFPPRGEDRTPARRRLTILHLAYEDPDQPGAGGGSVRTREINRRLARRHDITVVCAGWPRARDRVEEGVRYLHAGTGSTRFRGLSYLARCPGLARTAQADLIVDDFGAPISTLGLPRFTRTPVVAMVQWMFARQMWHKYHIPFHWVESWGVRAYQDFIAVSEGLADQIRQRCPAANVGVVHNGVDSRAYQVEADPGRFADPGAPLLYLGRLDIRQKGLDVLIQALAMDGTGRKLWVAGDGPDEGRLRRLAARAGVESRIRWLGRVSGATTFDLLAGACVTVVPSRFETFGIVAAESLACGTPVVATDIPCLRDVVPPQVGLTVPPDSPHALARAIAQIAGNPETAGRMGAAGREFARRFDWDVLAERQERMYQSLVDRPLGALIGQRPRPRTPDRVARG